MLYRIMFSRGSYLAMRKNAWYFRPLHCLNFQEGSPNPNLEKLISSLALVICQRPDGLVCLVPLSICREWNLSKFQQLKTTTASNFAFRDGNHTLVTVLIQVREIYLEERWALRCAEDAQDEMVCVVPVFFMCESVFWEIWEILFTTWHLMWLPLLFNWFLKCKANMVPVGGFTFFN